MRGNDSRNPTCHCGASSKMQISGSNTKPRKLLHFVCRLGKCDFFEYRRDGQRKQISLPDEGLVDLFTGHRLERVLVEETL